MRDVYGQMQCWIMTVKDYLTGLVYLCALPWKKAEFVAAELEKFFGFVDYPEIFHTGVYTIMLISRFLPMFGYVFLHTWGQGGRSYIVFFVRSFFCEIYHW
jgi:hypothetical protein